MLDEISNFEVLKNIIKKCLPIPGRKSKCAVRMVEHYEKIMNESYQYKFFNSKDADAKMVGLKIF